MSTTGNKEKLMSAIEITNNRAIGPNRTMMRSNISRDDNTARAPPLDIQINREVTVVNGDRSNLTWKRYKLIDINQRTGMCLVEGISDSRQRNFPRSVVKPKVYNITIINISYHTYTKLYGSINLRKIASYI